MIEKKSKTPIMLSDEAKDALRALGNLRGVSFTAMASQLLERVLVERPEIAANAMADDPARLLDLIRGQSADSPDHPSEESRTVRAPIRKGRGRAGAVGE